MTKSPIDRIPMTVTKVLGPDRKIHRLAPPLSCPAGLMPVLHPDGSVSLGGSVTASRWKKEPKR